MIACGVNTLMQRISFLVYGQKRLRLRSDCGLALTILWQKQQYPIESINSVVLWLCKELLLGQLDRVAALQKHNIYKFRHHMVVISKNMKALSEIIDNTLGESMNEHDARIRSTFFKFKDLITVVVFENITCRKKKCARKV